MDDSETGRREPERTNLREEFEAALAAKTRRKIRAREEGDRGIWFGLGMMGVVGWSVAIPTVLGIAGGVWLDARIEGRSEISWTLTGLMIGIILGCANAWFLVRRELEDDP